MRQQQVISVAKEVGSIENGILGHQEKGGLVIMPDQSIRALKHDNHRYNHGSDKPWGRDGFAFVEADTAPVGYLLDSPSKEKTVQVVSEWLAQMREGVIPDDATSGIEIEGVTYDQHRRLVPATGNLWPLADNHHPELLDHALETATGEINGHYPRNALEIALTVAQATLEGYEHADMQNKKLVFTSVPEVGDFHDSHITNHPYLKAFSPRVLQATLYHGNEIPREVLQLYNQLGMGDIREYLQQNQELIWPVNALHVHNGVPQIEGMADPRAAHAMAQVRMTEMAKILSMTLYNTKHCYGKETGLLDVRSIMRRLLHTSTDDSLPPTAQEFIDEAIRALEKGDIHSLDRHKESGQHDRKRLRMSGKLKTMESIDAPMTPDLRQILMWTYANQIMNVLALEALEASGGDESQVFKYLQTNYGQLMRPIPTMGEGSSYHHDLIVNSQGLTAKIPWMNINYLEALQNVEKIIDHIGQKYPGLKTQTQIVSYMIKQQLPLPSSQPTLEQYLGTETGIYHPNGLNRGILTHAKSSDIIKNIEIQAKATRLQAEALAQVHDDRDLLAWFGIY